MRILRNPILNKEAFVKIIILLGMSVFFISILMDGSSHFYVHPKMNKYILFGAIVMLGVVCLTFKELFKIPRRRMRATTYVVFTIPLLIAFIFPPISLSSASLPRREANIGEQKSYSQDAPTTDILLDLELTQEANRENKNIQPDSTQNAAADFLVIDDVIRLTDANFYLWLSELYENLDVYIGQEITLTGFVYRIESLSSDQFITSRFIMTCCAADVQIYGLLCEHEGAGDLEFDQWVEVTGVIKASMKNEMVMPLIEITTLNEIEKPVVEYIYPY